MDDKRFQIFVERLSALSIEEIQRIKDNIDIICFDTFNFHDETKTYCPLAVALNLHNTIFNPSNDRVGEEIEKRFRPVNVLKGVDGHFYTSHRREDLLKVCDFVLEQKNQKPIFIAEIKTKSPFGFKTDVPFKSLMDLAIKHGDWISVHTNALWGGDYDSISFVRQNTNKPILAKGFHYTDDDVRRALDHGANYVLVVNRTPHFRMRDKCLLELDTKEFNTMMNAFQAVGAFGLRRKEFYNRHKFVYNTRDLRTGLPKEKNELEQYIDSGFWICQASGISKPSDVVPGVKAFIVGEKLAEFCS
jgi:indole-3-glycerol phosphate synthase